MNPVNDEETRHPELTPENAARASRRSLLVGGAGAVGAFALTSMGTAMAGAAGHEKHDHSASAPRGPHSDLIESAHECIANGDACMAHCLRMFASGDTSMAACAASVQEMVQACETLAKFAAADSRHLRSVAEFCKAVCEDCEKACKEHAKKHAICQACVESCHKCVEACRSYLAG